MTFGDPESHQSSDDNYLEVVESEGATSIHYQDDSPYHSPQDGKNYTEYSIPDRNSQSVYESTSHFYNSFGSEKSDEPSYSLDESPKNSSPYYNDSDQSLIPSFQVKPKKKKEKSSRNNDFESYGKRKRKNDQDFSVNSKKQSINSTGSESLPPLKGKYSTSLSDSSDNSEDQVQNDYSKKEKSSKRKRQSYVESSGLKKRLESSNKGNLLMVSTIRHYLCFY